MKDFVIYILMCLVLVGAGALAGTEYSAVEKHRLQAEIKSLGIELKALHVEAARLKDVNQAVIDENRRLLSGRGQ